MIKKYLGLFIDFIAALLRIMSDFAVVILTVSIILLFVNSTYKQGQKDSNTSIANNCQNVNKVELNGEWYTCEKVKK